LHHARKLDDALQLKLAPAAANAWTLERVGEPTRLVAQILAYRIERRDFLQQLRAGFDPPALGVLDFAVHVSERLHHRREKIFDRRLPGIDIAGGLGARF